MVHVYDDLYPLQIENESLKRQLYDKQQLLTQAATAMTQLEEDYKTQLTALVTEQETRVQTMHEGAQLLQQVSHVYHAGNDKVGTLSIGSCHLQVKLYYVYTF